MMSCVVHVQGYKLTSMFSLFPDFPTFLTAGGKTYVLNHFESELSVRGVYIFANQPPRRACMRLPQPLHGHSAGDRGLLRFGHTQLHV